MVTSEKIKMKRQQLEKVEAALEKTLSKKKALQEEISRLETLEIQGCLKQIDVPFDEIRDLILSLRGDNK